MNNRIEVTINGEFKKNTDYFEMSDGVFWTVDALMRKYELGRSTLYNKARDNKIPSMEVLGIKCFKDSDKFNKLKNGAGNIENLKSHQLTSYAELHRSIEDLLRTVRSQTLPNGIDGVVRTIGELKVLINHQEERLLAMKDIMLDMNECVHNILDELTKGKKDGD